MNYLLQAINYILNSTAGNPSTTSRETRFGQVGGTNLSLQALYMIMYGMGKFFAYYGNVNADGLKGQGSEDTNICIGAYSSLAGMDGVLSGLPINGCNTGNDGHTDLRSPVSTTVIKSRLCQGVILWNNMFDILSNVTLSSNDSLGDLSDISTAVSLLYTLAATAETNAPFSGVGDGSAIVTLDDIRSQTDCEDQTMDHIIMYYVLLFESNFSNS